MLSLSACPFEQHVGVKSRAALKPTSGHTVDLMKSLDNFWTTKMRILSRELLFHPDLHFSDDSHKRVRTYSRPS